MYLNTNEDEMRYASIEVIREDEALYQQTLDNAIRFLKGAKSRFAEIKELKNIWDAIDAL